MLETTRMRNRRARGQRGAAMVEFALILPVLMSLVLGMVTGGAAYNRKLSMTNAVREGARFGATLPAVPGSWAPAVQERTEDVSAGDLRLPPEVASPEICVKLLKYPSTVVDAAPASCPFGGEPAVPTGVVANECVVKVWAERPAEIHALFFETTVTLTSSSVSRFEDSASC